MGQNSCIAEISMVPCFVYNFSSKHRYMYSYANHPPNRGLLRPPLLLRSNGGTAHAWKECRT